MGLNDIMKQPPKSSDQPPQPRTSSHAPPVSHAPKIVAASKKKKGSSERVQKVAFIGPAGVGKTHKIFSLMKHVALTYNLRPEQIRFEVIDLDSGIDELTDQSIIPDEYLDRIFISTCQTFSEVVDATKEAFQRLHEHKAEHGTQGCWIIVDNMEKAWQYPQEDYCQAVYGMSLTERMKVVRRQQLEAKKYGGKAEAVFNQNLDWGIITPMYMAWAKLFETSGVNFLWLSPFKTVEPREGETEQPAEKYKFGQSGNNQKVSYIVKLYYDSGGNRCADFVKARGVKGLPKNIRKTEWTEIFSQLDKLEEIENKQRLVDLQRENYASKKPTTADNNIEQDDSYVSADDFDNISSKEINETDAVPIESKPIDEPTESPADFGW